MRSNDSKNAVEARIVSNPHFARLLRQRLERRHGKDTACGKTLAELSDDDLVALYFHNEARGREHAAKRRTAEKRGYRVIL
jgi:hypothetical protein